MEKGAKELKDGYKLSYSGVDGTRNVVGSWNNSGIKFKNKIVKIRSIGDKISLEKESVDY